ncbi:tRNA pseudouridine synthase A [uncultured Ruminococcus sp.]|uniref:tRNA pseudouridine(38-40) synthase TruA n=1 Tax=Massiliimalia timonensis TaxID=1987501 RepID=UPI00082263DC|nr:tRNA pseudouridine(38-40) synthase TruA [Massiliimalia timonensis]MBS7176117.1 tRNA pseudouridine(38-40) synthase TruA [Clostridiales bacterium]SCH24789.1 tRNA pseudouridine synthase A [uncultured Ruminococcus sp.]SCH29527.1 tRNA pseudouridine synthase A [uncultured Clostridium sp.]
MRNLLFEIAYQGTRYHGYQVQENALSVAQVLQDAIEAVTGSRDDITGCSRTDTGVHANSFYFNMKTESRIPEDRFPIALNHALPPDIAVKRCQEVPMEFHARYHCLRKEYLYRIWNSEIRSPFLDGLVSEYKYPLDLPCLQKATQDFVGTYDFRAFCAAGGKEMETVRTIYEASICREEDDMVCFRVSGDGFLYHMVRIMVGTLLEINEGKIPPDSIREIIEQRDRTLAGRTAKPQGLYLNRVEYGDEWFGKTV